jgi:methylaspartate mutase epsilon subunit
MVADVRNRRWEWDEFLVMRKEILGRWPTGHEADLEETVAYHRGIPRHKNFALAVLRAKCEGITLAQPRGGFATIEEQISLLRALQDQGGADLLPLTTDSYTRNERFAEAEKGLAESVRAGRSLLNGLPLVNHGASAVRRITESVDKPTMVLSGTSKPCLTAEIGLAGGATGFLGGGISYTLSYTKELPLSEGVRNYQYLDRLCAYYWEQGAAIHREQPGFLTGTLIPPGLAVAIAVIEALLGVEQGLPHYSIGLGQCLCLPQDVAALRALERVCREYLERSGFRAATLTIASHQWMADFPQDEAQAAGVIALGALVAGAGGATQVITKSVHEALGIPAIEVNAAGVRLTRQILRMLDAWRLPLDPDLELEEAMIATEARAILDRTLELGDGDWALGASRAVEAGAIDVPWSPSRFNAGKALAGRDRSGAVRYLVPGNIPLPPEVLEYQRARLADRSASGPVRMMSERLLEDLKAISHPISPSFHRDGWRGFDDYAALLRKRARTA